jgi:mannose-6-phosphate isomerase class I
MTTVVQFATPAKEFELQQYHLHSQKIKINSRSVEIVLVLKGNIKLQTDKEIICLSNGDAAFIIADTSYFLLGAGEVFRATVPASSFVS